jgi:DNA polymerase IIIc chi subunit
MHSEWSSNKRNWLISIATFDDSQRKSGEACLWRVHSQLFIPIGKNADTQDTLNGE